MKTLDKVEHVCMNCGMKMKLFKGELMECIRCYSTDLSEVPTHNLSMQGEDRRVPVGEEACYTKALLQCASSLETQVGGSHYKNMAIQPLEYCQKNMLNHCESSIIKYASRHGNKNGAEDVRKIIHYAKCLLEIEYGETYEDNQL